MLDQESLEFVTLEGFDHLLLVSNGGVTDDYIIASESAALSVLGYEVYRDVQPGEAVFIDRQGQLHAQICHENPSLTPCIFEHVYLARPDSVLDNISVYKARLRMGDKLADQILHRFSNGEHDIDVVIPIPETSRTAAIPVANRLNVKLREGFVKNRYIGRTFIMPEQSMRRKSVRQKLNAIQLEFEGKNVLLIEDSIVRGTTLTESVRQARSAGAKKVYVASAAPPIRYPNVYGIDLPTSSEFLANNRNETQIANRIGADMLVYQTLPDLISAAQEGNSSIDGFECSVFDGEYNNPDISSDYLMALSKIRSNASKVATESALAFQNF